MKKLNKTTRRNFETMALVVVAYAIVKAVAMGGGLSSMMKGMLVPICAYVVMAVSLNLTVGVMGELSLGHAGFMSVGAFSGVSTAIILKSAGAAPAVQLLCGIVMGMIFAAIFGFLIGIPVLRLRGDYLAIVTLAFGEIIKSIFNNFYLGMDSEGLHMSFLNDNTHLLPGGKVIIGGPMGISGVPRIATFGAGILLILFSLIVIFNLVNSRTGRAIMAIRDNRIAAESVGINITKYKMIAFVVSAALAGGAGALFATQYSTIVANKFDFNTSILILVFVVLGGQGNMLGSIVAATLLTILPEALRQFSDYRMLVYAVLLIGMMLLTNSPAVKNFVETVKAKNAKHEEAAK